MQDLLPMAKSLEIMIREMRNPRRVQSSGSSMFEKGWHKLHVKDKLVRVTVEAGKVLPQGL